MSCVIDTHVHLYPCFRTDLFLEKAWRNLEEIAPGSQKALIVTERSSENYFQRASNLGSIGLYPLVKTDETESLIVELPHHRQIILIAGKQLVSSEGIEVLGMGTTHTIAGTMPASDIILSLNAMGAVPVVPWSFGKWMFNRKKVVLDLIANRSLSFYMGDIWGRHPLFGGDDIFAASRQSGRTIVFGTDPLPLNSEENIPGLLASEINEEISLKTPWQSIRDALGGSVQKGSWASLSESLFRQTFIRLSSLNVQ